MAQSTSTDVSADAPSTHPASLSLDYTGALFGYYRIEPDEPDDSIKLKPPREFLDSKPQHLLLGMGDNFGPEFGASVQRELGGPCHRDANPPWPGHVNAPPEILYKNEDRLPKMAECDNVGRFLMKAGYTAIVPGKEDFLYSAMWLHKMATLFRNAGNRKPLMLAANLRVNFKPEDLETGWPHPGIKQENIAANVKETCPLLFSLDPLPQLPQDDDGKAKPTATDLETCISGGEGGSTVTTESDWVRRLDLVVDQDPNCKPQPQTADDCIPVAALMNQQARNNATFRRQLLENEAKIVLATLTKDVEGKNPKLKDLEPALKALGDDKAFEKPRDANGRLDLNKDGRTQLAILKGKGECSDAKKDREDFDRVLCDLYDDFEVLLTRVNQNKVDFLLRIEARKAAIRLLLGKIAKEQRDVGYTIANGTLVIGVIGQETMKAVSPVNLRLCTLPKPLSAQALTEDLHACDERIIPKRTSADLDTPTARLLGAVKVGDPVLAVTTLVRAAWMTKYVEPFDKVVVMAQMPRTEAEELAARVLSSLRMTANCADLPNVDLQNTERKCGNYRWTANLPHVDLIVSEAQTDHETGNLKLRYGQESVIPVVAPRPAWYIKNDESGLVPPISTVTIKSGLRDSEDVRFLSNTIVAEESTGASDCRKNCLRTFAELLKEELDKVGGDPEIKRLIQQKPWDDLSILDRSWEACDPEEGVPKAEKKELFRKAKERCQDSVIRQFLLKEIQRSSNADVVLLEHRDFYFGRMLDDLYGSYEICDTWLPHQEKATDSQKLKEKLDVLRAYCRLRVALDRVLWKGDYSERVMVDGSTLKKMLTTAQQETVDEQTLAARDTTEEWLLTFGIVTELPKNLSAASMGPETFALTGWGPCKQDTAEEEAETPPYCVNGQKVTDDGAYWVSTSDHLARDKQIYKGLDTLDAKYHQKKTRLFLTGEIEDEILGHCIARASEDGAPPSKMEDCETKKASNTPASTTRPPETGMNKVEEHHQVRPILQLDYFKVVAGYTVHSPNVSDAQLATNFQGVTESRAQTPHAGEIDFEAAGRATRGLGSGDFLRRMKVGIQSDLEYDRNFLGNLTGSPETVTYPINGFNIGGFLQYRLLGDGPLPHLLLVVAPYQYQQQVTGNYLNLTVPQKNPLLLPITLPTVPTKRWEGFTQRLGLRYEIGGPKWRIFDSGSYAEAGPEYSEINHVLSALNVPNGMPCSASAAGFVPCLTNTAVTSTTVLTPQYLTLHTGGAYWDVHLQKALDKGKHSSLTIETKGDHFVLPGKTLPTQSSYAFTTTEALNFAAIGNLMFSPTYTTFFYRNQGEGSHSLITNNFSITAKWYFGRDAAVPFWRQLWFRGPASLDQTKSAQMK
jgi:hypothetical protein